MSNATFETLPIFNLQYPTSIAGVDSKILNPKQSWVNKEEYEIYARKVADMFNDNFERYSEDASAEVKMGAPDA